MVEQLNRKRVLNFFNAFYARDIDGALACCTDDVDFIANAPIDVLPHMGHRHGKAEVGEMWKTVHARYSSMRYELPFIVAEGDHVASLIRAFFRKSGNDRIVQFDIAFFAPFAMAGSRRSAKSSTPSNWVQQVLERDVAADLAKTKPRKT